MGQVVARAEASPFAALTTRSVRNTLFSRLSYSNDFVDGLVAIGCSPIGVNL